RAGGRGEGDRGLRDHRLAPAGGGDRRAAARADDGRRRDRRAARPDPYQQAPAPRRDPRPVPDPPRGLRGRRRQPDDRIWLLHRAAASCLGRAPAGPAALTGSNGVAAWARAFPTPARWRRTWGLAPNPGFG